jgi:uncharacterized cupin superfamily protein
MAPEAPFDDTGYGRMPKEEGWFVLNARDARWFDRGARGKLGTFEGEDAAEFKQVGIHLFVLEPGNPMSMYHWEADQEDFLVLSGEALLIVEGEERRLRQWDFVHCPPRVSHTIVGAGDGPCAILAVGARIDSMGGDDWGGYPLDETAARHNAGSERETNDPKIAYARFRPGEPARYREGWLPDFD